MNEKLSIIEDDGLLTPEVGPWSERKYRLVENYARMFATSMKRKWDCRVYLDLFAGAGHARIKETTQIVPASPIISLNIPDKFDKYIFCEADTLKCDTLKKRVSRDYSGMNTTILNVDVNNDVEAVLRSIPQHHKAHRVLSFCFVDPCKMDDLNFEVIRALSNMYIDFLVLIPSWMDVNRNRIKHYEKADSPIEKFTGELQWRKEWAKAQLNGLKFGDFVAELFAESMKKLKYHKPSLADMVLIKWDERNLPLYHLVHFSRDVTIAQKFWKEARKYSTDQIGLF